jgi:hypothetical protein
MALQMAGHWFVSHSHFWLRQVLQNTPTIRVVDKVFKTLAKQASS